MVANKKIAKAVPLEPEPVVEKEYTHNYEKEEANTPEPKPVPAVPKEKAVVKKHETKASEFETGYEKEDDGITYIDTEDKNGLKKWVKKKDETAEKADKKLTEKKENGEKLTEFRIAEPGLPKTTFEIDNYLKKLDIIIFEILSRPEAENLTYDILDTEKTMKLKLIALKERHRQMKVGEIWQNVLGNYDEFTNLHNGHKTGLDIISTKKKIIIELKNRTNTDNSSSRKTNLAKLAKFKKENLDYTCIYATINDSSKKKTLNGCIKHIRYDEVDIEHRTGYVFLKFIMEENTDRIIELV